LLFPPRHIYHQETKAYIAHLAKKMEFSLQETTLADHIASETVVKDNYGSHWIALYQPYVHLECTMPLLS
jgi:hypothetical protein